MLWMIITILITNIGMFGGVCYAALRVERQAKKIETRATKAFLNFLKEPSNQETIVSCFANERVAKIVGKNIKEAIIGHFSGLISGEKRREKKILAVAQEEMVDTATDQMGLGGLMDLLPPKMKELFEKNPQMLVTGLRIFGPLISQRLGLGNAGDGHYG